jgi:hypothetical protein
LDFGKVQKTPRSRTRHSVQTLFQRKLLQWNDDRLSLQIDSFQKITIIGRLNFTNANDRLNVQLINAGESDNREASGYSEKAGWNPSRTVEVSDYMVVPEVPPDLFEPADAA